MTDTERREIMENMKDRQKKEMNNLVQKQKDSKQIREKAILSEPQN